MMEMSEQSEKFKYEPKKNRNGYVQVSFPQFYSFYKKQDKIKNKIQNYKLARNVLEFIFKRVWHYMIKETWIFKAPFKIGMFYIAENPYSKGFYKNWQKTRKKGELVYDYNLETSGHKPFIKWAKNLYKSSAKDCYRFRAFRGSKESGIGYRGMWAYIKELANDPFQKDFRGHIL